MSLSETFLRSDGIDATSLGRQSVTRRWREGHTGFRLTCLLVLVDLACVALSFTAGALISDVTRDLLGLTGGPVLAMLAGRAQDLVLLAVLLVGVFAFGGLYRRASWELDEIWRILAAVALIAMFDTTLQFALDDHTSRLWFLGAYPLMAASIILGRMAIRSLPMVRQAMTSHVILIGTGVEADKLIYEMRASRAGPVKLLGSIEFSKIAARDPRLLDQMLDRLARNSGIPAYRVVTVLAPSAEEISSAEDTIALLNLAGRSWSVVLPFRGLARNGLSLQKVIGADTVMADMRPSAPGIAALRLVKRGFDLAAGLLITLLLAPVLLTFAAFLSFEGGPVFFKQLRVGRNGRRFWCYKFRSMRPDAEERLTELLATDPAARAEWNMYQKLRNDPRITPIGQFLRKTSLDELPQLLNVIMGDMSLVGPRPIIAPEVDGYPSDRAYAESDDFIYYEACTPGITGLWQVSGRSDTSHDERVRLDRWYARNWSCWLDLLILLRTVRVVLFRTGSV
jgi:undecaprenyl-phosphate galactose phosphotransferase